MDPFFNLTLFIYVLSSFLLLPYPLNYIYLAIKSKKYTDPIAKVRYSFSELPEVTIHLPVYNESYVIQDTLQNILHLEYPKDKIKILIIDDSTDSTTQIIKEFIQNLSTSIFIKHIQRFDNRKGYKAGALDYALKQTTSEFIILIDADFRLPASFLRDTIHHFKDNPLLAAVQTRWIHSNQNFSLFTRSMSIAIDGHFLIEKPGRFSTNSLLSFNGTGGIWRKKAIEIAGGWSARTLAEDLDLAYRSQFKGFEIIFLKNICVMQEIAPTIRNWAIQQQRWSQGFSQNIRQHLKPLLMGNHGKNKIQGVLQLSSYFLPFFLLINLLSSTLLLYSPINVLILLFFGTIIGIVSSIGILVYIVSILRADRSIKDIFMVPLFLFFGIALSIRISYGLLIGLIKNGGSFQRTPKFNLQNKQSELVKKQLKHAKIPLDRMFFVEFSIFIVIIAGFLRSITFGNSNLFTSLFLGTVAASILNLLFSEAKHAGWFFDD